MRVGVLGVGRIGAFHARALAAMDEVEQVVVADADHARAEAFAVEAGVEAGADARVEAASVADVYAKVDAVVIAAPTAVHADLLRRAADAGLPILCEKPIALDPAIARDVVAYVHARGAGLHVGFQRRFDPMYVAARAAVRAGAVGTLTRVHAVSVDRQPPHPAFVPGSGGIYRDTHIHDFDIVPWVTGVPIVEVTAIGANRGADVFRENDDVDVSAVLFRLADDTLGTAHAGRQHAPGYDVRLEVAGTAGTHACGGVTEGDFLTRFGDAYRAELAAFVAMVAGRAASPCTGAEALAAQAVAEACVVSRREGRPVRVR
ncbi:Gfo/Idh/MocA family oxidoreductase [Embleya sp. NBC_00896]|uniref:Gfo/Idh/MocA family oxidoreductase n=1 Tax=Embleya sp. NBC_00896 TaxID=2975961 RepID=UPI003869625C|nr:Gfo/Idh/MocA family oxidoreductase [Embleya sp. NBC_00896]